MTSTASSAFSSQSQSFSSPFSASDNEIKLAIQDNHPKYEYRVQSSRFCEDNFHYDDKEIDALVVRNMGGRVTQVGERLAAALFPDTAFGFPINDDFLLNFFGSFLSSIGLLGPGNFASERSTCVFLNKMITTIDAFLQATKEPELTNFRPLRYFTSLHATTPIAGGGVKRKTDLILVRLINGCLRQGTLHWHDIQTLVEHTREFKPPMRMMETVTSKTYQIFCSQPERDFIISLCITGEGFHIVVADHSGIVETDVIKITQNNISVLVRMVMGLAFLPDSFLGVDASIIRRELGIASSTTLQEEYKPYDYKPATPLVFLRGSRVVAEPLAITKTRATKGFDENFSKITIGGIDYPVICVVFSAKSFIGRATRAFLVQLPDGSKGVLKDSWIPRTRSPEWKFLEGLVIPFGPQILGHDILRNTGTLRTHPYETPALDECREKRRILIYPAGVHIADFACLWELMAAFMDIVIGMYDKFRDFFLCYLIQYLFHSYHLP